MSSLLVSIVRVFRRRGYNQDDARDLTQGFFLHLLEHKTLTHIDPSRGKFRSFLLGSLQNFLTLEATRARCLKRGGAIEFVFLDAKSAEDRYQLEPLDTLMPEMMLVGRWPCSGKRRAGWAKNTQRRVNHRHLRHSNPSWTLKTEKGCPRIKQQQMSCESEWVRSRA
jgi:hypothetical protein